MLDLPVRPAQPGVPGAAPARAAPPDGGGHARFYPILPAVDAMQTYDKIIIGAGMYGLYAAESCSARGEHVLVLECGSAPFTRATYINQARIHMGYHYPRSYSTAIKSAEYFERFCRDYAFCILSDFDQIYATSSQFSWTNADQFIKFCKDAGIPFKERNPNEYFNPGMCDGAFLTKEYTYDAAILRDYFLDKLNSRTTAEIKYGAVIEDISPQGGAYVVSLRDGQQFETGFLLNTTYASTNQITRLTQHPLFKIKYELCEIILCGVTGSLKNMGLTIMDGPFFSIMPFGRTGLHSLTSVTFTPHMTCYEDLPVFPCQENNDSYCSPYRLGNCSDCPRRPETAWPYMSNLARKYMRPEYQFTYSHSLFSMKPILRASEVDDSRPTVIRRFSQAPTYVSVLSGKINTVYDLEEVLNDA